jgi:hypothetical protein
MNLLGAINYDPAGAVSKVTTSLLAMTAFDTTNLRIAFTVPSHGIAMVKMSCVHHGSTTIAQVMLGVLEGSTVRGRQSGQINILQTAIATSMIRMDVSYTLTGLTPGAVNWDAAYGVEIVASANGAIKYGGPNNTTTNDNFGGFNFEIWDPKSEPTNFGLLSIDANGRIDVIKVAGTTQTARDLGASVLLSSGTGTGQLDFTSGVVKANTTQLAGSAIDQSAGLINANVKQISGDATAADNEEAFFDGTGYAGTGNTIPTVTNLTNAPTNGDLTTAMKASVNAEADTALSDYGALKPTIASRTLDVTATGEAGVDWANIGAPTTVVNLSGTTIKTATDVETDTAVIGAAGAGLTAVPWNASWDAEVQSEVQDALEANNLDHLIKIAVDTDFATTVHLNSVVGHLADNGTSATFDRTTDSLEALQAEHDATQTAALTAAGVRTAVGLTSANLDTQLSGIQFDTENIQGRLPIALSGDGYIRADIKSIDDELTDGANATLNLKKLNIENSAGDALVVRSSGSDGNGASFASHGNGMAIKVRGGATGTGIDILGGASGGYGVAIEAQAANFPGLFVQGIDGAGAVIEGAQEGLLIIGGDSGNGDGLSLFAQGTGKSIRAEQDIAVSDGNLTLAAIASAVWANATRTLTAISDSAGITTLLSRIAGALNISGGKVESNVKQINGTNVTGDGSGTPWGPA